MDLNNRNPQKNSFDEPYKNDNMNSKKNKFNSLSKNTIQKNDKPLAMSSLNKKFSSEWLMIPAKGSDNDVIKSDARNSLLQSI